MSEKLFGTDGIRGVANQHPLTPDFCTKLAYVLSKKICTENKRVALARDTRVSGFMLLSSLAAGFTSQGIDVLDLGIVPTPLCTTVTPQLGVDMSIMITASHNPYKDNGLKLITSAGNKFSDKETAEIEKLLKEDNLELYHGEKTGTIIPVNTGLSHYLTAINSFTVQNSLSGMKIVLDSANGAFSGILSNVFAYLGASIISLSDRPDGFNINENCGSQHTETLCKTVVENGFHLGIAVDGDGDRIIICDEKGNRIDGDQIIAYLATFFKNHGALKGNSVVATVYSNLGLGKYIKSLGIEYHTCAVGERYVIEKMREVGSNVGGEESGHMVLSDYTKTGDALLTAVIVCLGIKESQKLPSEIFPIFEPFPNQTHNLRYETGEEISTLLASEKVKSCVAEIEKQLQEHGRIILRKSGTEPVLRLKIEDENVKVVEEMTDKIMKILKK